MLKGQRILVTGANGGIGSSICEALLQNNAQLVLLYNQKSNNIERLLDMKKGSRLSVEAFQVDLLDSEMLTITMEKIIKSSKVDVFIHAATMPIINHKVSDTRWEDYQMHIDIQAGSFLRIVQAILPSMTVNRRGKIISILTAATVGRPPSGMSDYVVGKYSLLGLSKSMAVELGHLGITVNCVSPSMTNTPLTEKFPHKLKEIASSQVPLGRLAEPSDIASVVLFLCSEHSNYISGENFLVTGGQTMH